MKIVFMGTPDFAATVLEALLASTHEVTAVITQPDKQKGRGKEVQCPPVKECALAHGIPVYQPVRIKAPEAVAHLRTLEADIFVVAAFGQILSKEILDMPQHGCICVHASLLPKYRGAAPIQWAILDGEQETGVTIMQMNEGIDTGDMILKAVVPITEDETGDSLHDKLAVAGAALCTDVLDMMERGEVQATVQDSGEATYAKMLTKEMGHINWNDSARTIDRLIRGMYPNPGTYTFFRGKRIKIHEAVLLESSSNDAPGKIFSLSDGMLHVKCSDGAIGLLMIQPENHKKMSASDFINGYKVTTDESFEY